MAYNTSAVLTQLQTIASGLANVGAVQIGAPESVSPRVHIWITMGSMNEVIKAGGLVQRTTRFLCMFAYRVDSAEATAETTLAALVDAFLQAVNADKTLNGTALSSEVSSQAADEPAYEVRAAKEYREYPLIVTVTQQDTYEVNP